MPAELIHAILNPPDVQRFRELTGVGDAELEVSFHGWVKLAVLTDDRVFLFPRRGRDARLVHGARVCEALASLAVDCAPRVVGQWPDGVLSAGPFVAFERRFGVAWHDVEDDRDLDEIERMLGSLGAAIATWHSIEVADLPTEVRRPPGFDGKQPWLDAFLDPARVDAAVEAAVRLLDPVPSRATVWRKTLRELATMPPVLVHGDVCENQLLVDAEGLVHTVLDWDTAGVGHLLLDFDFGEWGLAIFGWEPQFGRLRRVMWDGYRAGRPDTELPGADDVHLLFTLAELAYFEQNSRQGPLDAWGTTRLARCRDAIGPATDALHDP